MAFRDGENGPEAKAGAMLIATAFGHIHAIAKGLGVIK